MSGRAGKLPKIKQAKDWDQWQTSLKGMAKMNGIYGILDETIREPKAIHHQDTYEYDCD